MYGDIAFEENSNLDLFCRDRRDWQDFTATWKRTNSNNEVIFSLTMDADIVIAATNMVFIKKYIDFLTANPHN